MQLDRRGFIAAGAAGVLVPGKALAEGAPVLTPLADFIIPYMAAMNAPGMIVGIADAKGWSEAAAFGFADTASRRAIRAQERFHIGSITKSFTALMILQLAEEGKVALDADITSYLPELQLKTAFAPITVHHLLCHSSGVPSEGPSPGWPDQVSEQVFMPGSKFHYCNKGYTWLGRIVAARGGESWAQALHRRILDPLEMRETFATIGAGMRVAEVPSYFPLEDDRPFPRNGPLTRATPLTFDSAAGCIASTARDMNRYIQMLARHGEGPKGRVLSPESFALMTKRHIDAAEFGPTAGYGYGWMLTDVDGKPVIRHTGGMVSFMSSIHIDLEAGFGAFASINAQQGYRPVPVTAYAISLYRASAAKTPLPKRPETDPDTALKLSDYAGRFVSADGSAVALTSTPKGLQLAIAGKMVALESLGEDRFVCRDPEYRLFAFQFARGDAKPNSVVGLVWGRDAWVKPGAKLPSIKEENKVSLSAAELASYEGFYAMGDAWVTAARVVARDGRLWLDGVLPLAAQGNDRFRFADEAANPEVAAFSPPRVTPRTLAIGGAVLTRIGDPFMETL